jgi:osmotically inducible protein OsmC
MERNATAVWRGSLKEGKGIVSAASGVLANVPYTFAQRFENAPGTNPEELIASAHASCFSMALSAELGKAGLTPDSVETRATVTLEPKDGKQTISKIHLDTTAKVPSATNEAFQKAAEDAKAGCPISRLFKADISLTARLA